MPKMKTHKAAVKRFKLTKKGKLIRARAYGNHILEKKVPGQEERRYKKCIGFPR